MHPVTPPHPLDRSLRLGLVSGTVVYRPSRALKVMLHRLYRELPPPHRSGSLAPSNLATYIKVPLQQ